jgi:hypothetical protein
MPWSVQRESLDPRTVKVTLSAGSLLTYDEVIRLWQGDEGFRRFFTEAVRDSGFEAFFWETPPVTLSTLGRPFEFVVVEGGALARLRADPQPFSTHFAARPCPAVLSFPNLGGDATLIVPAPVSPDHACYTHLHNLNASFIHAGWACEDAMWCRSSSSGCSRCPRFEPGRRCNARALGLAGPRR